MIVWVGGESFTESVLSSVAIGASKELAPPIIKLKLAGADADEKVLNFKPEIVTVLPAAKSVVTSITAVL
jgi:hypothetical protein